MLGWMVSMLIKSLYSFTPNICYVLMLYPEEFHTFRIFHASETSIAQDYQFEHTFLTFRTLRQFS